MPAVVTGLEHETDVATLQKALRLLVLENERLVKLNLELQKALAEAKGERVEQLELEIAELQQTVAARNQALSGDSSERRPRPVADPQSKPRQPGHGPRKQDLPLVERLHELVRTRVGGRHESRGQQNQLEQRATSWHRDAPGQRSRRHDRGSGARAGPRCAGQRRHNRRRRGCHTRQICALRSPVRRRCHRGHGMNPGVCAAYSSQTWPNSLRMSRSSRCARRT